jgi:hypothetical protein
MSNYRENALKQVVIVKRDWSSLTIKFVTVFAKFTRLLVIAMILGVFGAPSFYGVKHVVSCMSSRHGDAMITARKHMRLLHPDLPVMGYCQQVPSRGCNEISNESPRCTFRKPNGGYLTMICDWPELPDPGCRETDEFSNPSRD